MASRDAPAFPLPWVTEAGVLGFFGIAASLLVLREDYDPVRRYLSEYAVGQGGWAMRAGFALLGLASLNLVPGLLGDRAPGSPRRVGWALAAWGAAVLVAAAFPVDLQGAPVTGTGAVHLAASGVAFLALFVALVLGARSFPRSPAWRDLGRRTRQVAVLAPASFLLEVTVFASLGWVGVGQWLLFGLAGAWILDLGRHFRSGRPPARP